MFISHSIEWKLRRNIVEASKVTISQATLNGPLMTRKRKLNLRRNLILEYIRSKPAGTPISTSELIRAGQYKSHGSGWQQIQTMKKKKLLVQENIPKSHKSLWHIPGDAKVKTVYNKTQEEKIELTPKHDYNIRLKLVRLNPENNFLEEIVADVQLGKMPLHKIKGVVDFTFESVEEVFEK